MTMDEPFGRWRQYDVLAEDAAPGPGRRRARFRLFRRNLIPGVLRRRRDGLLSSLRAALIAGEPAPRTGGRD